MQKKVAVVTGANVGLGYETVKGLIESGYSVVLACRDEHKAMVAINILREEFKTSDLRYIHLDLCDYRSVHEFVDQFNAQYEVLDLLVNNAGVMMPPYTLTKNKQELQFDSNHLGHFLLTGLLLNKLNMSSDPRVVVVSSLAHKGKKANIHFDDINFSKKYKSFVAYSQSKLANALFGVTFARKYENIKVIVAHPGVCDTNLSRYFPKYLMIFRPLVMLFLPITKPHEGAASILDACLSEVYKSGEYVGPVSKKEWSGPPGVCAFDPKVYDVKLQDDLWALSEGFTNIKY